MGLSKDLYNITPEVIVEKDYNLTWRSLSESVSRIIEPDKELMKQRMWNLTGGRSFWSGKKLTEKDQFGRWKKPEPGTVEWDHVIPAYKGGLAISYNLLPAGKDENQMKKGMQPLTFYRVRKALNLPLPWSNEEEFLEVLEDLNKKYYDSIEGIFEYDESKPLPGQLMRFLMGHEAEWAPTKKRPYWQDIAMDRDDFADLVRLSHYSHPAYAKDSRGKRTYIRRRKKVAEHFGTFANLFLKVYDGTNFYELSENQWTSFSNRLRKKFRSRYYKVVEFYGNELISVLDRARKMHSGELVESDVSEPSRKTSKNSKNLDEVIEISESSESLENASTNLSEIQEIMKTSRIQEISRIEAFSCEDAVSIDSRPDDEEKEEKDG